jgi:hypothetical protein
LGSGSWGGGEVIHTCNGWGGDLRLPSTPIRITFLLFCILKKEKKNSTTNNTVAVCSRISLRSTIPDLSSVELEDFYTVGFPFHLFKTSPKKAQSFSIRKEKYFFEHKS